jgi:hypothetical protein
MATILLLRRYHCIALLLSSQECDHGIREKASLLLSSHLEQASKQLCNVSTLKDSIIVLRSMHESLHLATCEHSDLGALVWRALADHYSKTIDMLWLTIENNPEFILLYLEAKRLATYADAQQTKTIRKTLK